jgi:hypothetical protein
MVEYNNEEERLLRIERTLARLVRATAELQAINRLKVIVETPPLVPRQPRTPRKWDRRV